MGCFVHSNTRDVLAAEFWVSLEKNQEFVYVSRHAAVMKTFRKIVTSFHLFCFATNPGRVQSFFLARQGMIASCSQDDGRGLRHRGVQAGGESVLQLR